MSNQHILPADYWTQHVYNISPGKEIKCFGHKIKDKKVMDNLLRQALKNIESKSSISGVRLTADVDPSDLTKKTNVMVRKAIDSAKQQANNDAKKALLEIQKANTTAIKRNITAGSTPNPTMATPTVPPSGSKSTVMTTSSDGSEAKATVREALGNLQKAVKNKAQEFQKTVTDTVQGAVKAAGDAVADARETAAATITNAAKAISPKPATTPAAASAMGGGRRRTKRRKRRRKHKTKHKRKKKRTTRKRKKRTRRRRR